MMYGRLIHHPKDGMNEIGKEHSGISCGMHFLYGVQFSRKTDLGIVNELLSGVLDKKVSDRVTGTVKTVSCAIIVFSDADRNGGGKFFADIIRTNKLGALVETEPTRNPNSGNQIRGWLWTVDYPAIKTYLDAQPQ